MTVAAPLSRTIHHPDPVVQEVLDVWTARFLSGQIPLGDLTETVGRTTDWSSWGEEWMRTAEMHEAHDERIASDAADATLKVVEGGLHGVDNKPYRYSPFVNDWLAASLGGTRT